MTATTTIANSEPNTLSAVDAFLHAATPQAWIDWAVRNQSALLWDHSNCEKKAASSALSLLFRYPDHEALVYRMSRLAREELRHFEQVQKIIVQRELDYLVVPAPKYVAQLRTCIRTTEPQRLVDQLVVGAYIEARSCERFGRLAPHLDDELQCFYSGLMESEARHFEQYLSLAQPLCSTDELQERITLVGKVEAQAIVEPVDRFAFHSGPPSASV